MINNASRKCFKISSFEEINILDTIQGDVVYVRNHPYVYLNDGYNKWIQFTKVYVDKTNPKYNFDKYETLEKPYMFKIEASDEISSVPAKHGDLIYKNGDPFMYMKEIVGGKTHYIEIRKN
jgi:hypothetical protein